MTILWPNGLTTPPNFSWEGQFGPRNADLSYASKYHRGQDFYGFTTVCSVADGTVVSVGRRSGWAGGGYMVWIQHDGFFSRSLHLAQGSAKVVVGQRVTAGQPIGIMGNTNGGVAGMEIHLHLEITTGQWHSSNMGQIDPRKFLEERVGKSNSNSGSGGSASSDPNLTINKKAVDIMAESYIKTAGDGTAKENYGKGTVFYTRPGLLKKFSSVDDYKAWQETINGLRDNGQTNMAKVPFISTLKDTPDWRAKAIFDANGV